MPTLELKDPTTTDNSVANSIPFNDWIAKTIQKTYSRPGDAVTYRPPSISQDNPELNLLNEKITVSIGAETNPNGTSISGISGKGNAIVDDVNPQSGPIDPNSSTRWEVGGTPTLDKKQIEITRAELPSVLAQDTNATFKDSLLGDKEYKVSDFFANQKKFENIKNTDSAVGNSIYSKFINYDDSKTDILYDKNNSSQPSIIPTKTALWGQDQNQQEYVKQKLIETNGFTPDYVKQLTNRMYVFPNIQLDSNTQASIIKGEFGYDGIAQVAMNQDGLDPVQFAKNLAKLGNDKLDTNNLIRGTEAKEIRYDLNGAPIVTDRGDYAWNEAVKNINKDGKSNANFLGVIGAGLSNLSKSLGTTESQNPWVAEQGVKIPVAGTFGLLNTAFSNLSDSFAGGIAAGYFTNLASFGEGLIKNDTSKVKFYKPEENIALSTANAKAVSKSVANPDTGKAPESFIEGALNLASNIVKGDAKLFDRKVINEQIAKTAKTNTQQALKSAGFKEDASIAGVRVDDSAATFTVGTIDFVGTVALSQGTNFVKGANLLGAGSRLLPGWAGISMFAKDYTGVAPQDRYKEALKTYTSAKFEQVVQDRFLEKVFDNRMLWAAQKEGSKLLSGVLTTPGLVSQLDNALLQVAGLAKAPLKYKLMNATGNGLIEFGVGVGGDALINSAFDGKVKPPTGDDWVQNALFGLVFAAAPKVMKSNRQMYGEVINNLKVDKLGESVHGDLESVVNKMSSDTDRIDILNKKGDPTTTILSSENANAKNSFSQIIKQKFGIDNLNVKGNFTLTESLSRDALINLVGSSTKEKGQKVSQSQRILNELLTKAAQATPDSPYNGFTKLYTLEGVNAQGETTSEILAVGVDKDLKPLLLTSDDLLEESGLETAKKTNVAIDVLSNLVSSKNYTDFSNAQRGSIATYIEGGQPRLKFKDNIGNWMNLDGSDASSNPPTGANFSLNTEQALDFIGVKQPINQLLKANVTDSVTHKVLLDTLSTEGQVGFLNRFKETVVDPENEVQTKGFEFNLDDDYAKEIEAEEARIQEVIPNQIAIDEYKAGDILSDVIPEKVSQAGAEAIIGYIPKLSIEIQRNLVTSLPVNVSNNVNNWPRYISIYNEYKDQIEVESKEVATESTLKADTPVEKKSTKDSVTKSTPSPEKPVGPNQLGALRGSAKAKKFNSTQLKKIASIMTGRDIAKLGELTKNEATSLGNFFQGQEIKVLKFFNNLKDNRLTTGMKPEDLPKDFTSKVADEAVVPAETKPPKTDKPLEPTKEEAKTEVEKPSDTTPEVAPVKEETTKKDKKPGISFNKESKPVSSKMEPRESKPPKGKNPKVNKPEVVKPKIDATASEKADKEFRKIESDFTKGLNQEANYLENNWDSLLKLIEQEKNLPVNKLPGRGLNSGLNPISKVMELSGWKLPIEGTPFSENKPLPEIVSQSIKDSIISNVLSSKAKNIEEAYQNLFIKTNSSYNGKPEYKQAVLDIQNAIYNLNNPENNLFTKDVPTVENVTNEILSANGINQLDIDNKKKEAEYQRAYQESGLGGDYLDLDTKNIVNEDIRTKYDNFLNSVRDIWSNESKYQELILGSENIPAFKDGVNKEWNSLSNKLQNQIKEIYNSDYGDGQTGFNQDAISKIWDKGIVIKKDKDFDSEKAKADLFLEKVKLLIENESEIDNLQTTDIPGVFEQPISEIKRGSIVTYTGEDTKYGSKNVKNGDTFYVKFKLGENIVAFPNTPQNIQSFEDNQIVPLAQYVNFKVAKEIKVDNIFDLGAAQESKTFTQSYLLKDSNNKKLTKKDTDKVKAGNILTYAGETIPGKLKKEQKLIAKESTQDGLLRLYPLTAIKNIYNQRNATVATAPKWETIRENTQAILDELNDPIYDTLEPITFKAMDETKEASTVKDKLDLSKEEKFIELNDLFNTGKFDEYQKLFDSLSKKDQDTFQEEYQDSDLTQAFYAPSTAVPVINYDEVLKNNIIQSLNIADINTLNNTAITTRSIRFGGDIMDKISNNSKRKLQSLLVDISNGNIGLSDGGGKLLEPATIVAFQKEITKRINTGKAIDMEFLANTIINGESLWRVINRSQNRNSIPMMEMNQELLDKGILEPLPVGDKFFVEKGDKVKVRLIINIGDFSSNYHINLLPHAAETLIKNKGFVKINKSSASESKRLKMSKIRQENMENINFLEGLDKSLNKNFPQLLEKVKEGLVKITISRKGNVALDTPGMPTLRLNRVSPQKLETLRAVTQVLNNFDNSSLDKNRQFSNTLSNIIQTYEKPTSNSFISELLGLNNSSNARRGKNYNDVIGQGVSYLLEERGTGPTGRGASKALQMELLNDGQGKEANNGQGVSNETRTVYRKAIKLLKDNKVKITTGFFNDYNQEYDKNVYVVNEALEMIRNQGGQDQLDGQLALLRTVLPIDISIDFINNIREIYPELQAQEVYPGLYTGLNNIRLLTSEQLKSGIAGSYTASNNSINIDPLSDRLDTIHHELVHAKDTQHEEYILSERISRNPNNFLELMYAFTVWSGGGDNAFIQKVKLYLNQPFASTESNLKEENNINYINPIIERLKVGDIQTASNIFGQFFDSLDTFRQHNIAGEFNAHYQQMMLATGNADKLDIFTSLSDVPSNVLGLIVNPVLPQNISTNRFIIPSNQMEQALRETPLKQAQGPKQQPQQVQWNQILSDEMKINLFKIQKAQRDDLATLQEMNKDLIRINNSKNSSITMEDSQKEAIQTLNTLKKDLATIKDYNSTGYDQWVNTYNDLADKLPTLDSQLAAMKYIGINQPVIDTMNNLLAIDPRYLKLRLDTIKFNTQSEANGGEGLINQGAVDFREKALYITLTGNTKELQTTITHELSHLLFDESARNKLRLELIKEPTRIFDIFDSLNSSKNVINSYLQGAKNFAVQEYNLYNTQEQTDKYVAKLENQLALMANVKDTMFYRSLVGQFYSGLTSGGKAAMETEYFAHLMEMAYQDGDYQTIRDLLKPANRVPIQLGFGQRGEFLSYNPMMDNRVNGFDPNGLRERLNALKNSTVLRERLNALKNEGTKKPVYKVYEGEINSVQDLNSVKEQGFNIISSAVNLQRKGLSSVDLSGIRAITNNLDLSSNQLTSFNVKELNIGYTLNLLNNKLTSFIADNLTIGRHLVLSDNQLTSFNVKKLKIIGDLLLNRNKLTSFNVASIDVYGKIDLSFNQITSFRMNNSTIGGDLDLRGNNITSFNGEGLTIDGNLDLSNNQLDIFDGKGLTIKGDLILSRNQIKSFNTEGLEVEGGLILKNNPLKSFSLKEIESLNVGGRIDIVDELSMLESEESRQALFKKIKKMLPEATDEMLDVLGDYEDKDRILRPNTSDTPIFISRGTDLDGLFKTYNSSFYFPSIAVTKSKDVSSYGEITFIFDDAVLYHPQSVLFDSDAFTGTVDSGVSNLFKEYFKQKSLGGTSKINTEDFQKFIDNNLRNRDGFDTSEYAELKVYGRLPTNYTRAILAPIENKAEIETKLNNISNTPIYYYSTPEEHVQLMDKVADDLEAKGERIRYRDGNLGLPPNSFNQQATNFLKQILGKTLERIPAKGIALEVATREELMKVAEDNAFVDQMTSQDPSITAYGSFQTIEGRKGILTLLDTIVNPKNEGDAVQGILTANHELGHAFVATLPEDTRESFLRTVDEFNSNLTKDNNLDNAEEIAVEYLSREFTLQDAISTQEANQKARTLWGQFKSFVSRMWKALTNLVRTGKLDVNLDQSVIDQSIVDEFTRLRDEFVQDKNIDTEKLAPFVQEFSNWLESPTQFSGQSEATRLRTEQESINTETTTNDSETFNPEAIASTQQQAQTVEGTDPRLAPQATENSAMVVDRNDDETLQAKTIQEETKDLTTKEYDNILANLRRSEPNNPFYKVLNGLTGTANVFAELISSQKDLLYNQKSGTTNLAEADIEAGVEANSKFQGVKALFERAKEKFDKSFSLLQFGQKNKEEQDAFYRLAFTGEKLPDGSRPPLGFTYDSNLDKVVPVFENVVKSVSEQTPFQRIAFNESIYAGNTIEKIFSDTPIGSILVTYYYDPKTDVDKESATMVPKRVKPLDRLRFEDAVEKGALNSIDDILKQVTETPENKSVNNISISGIITPLTAYTVNQPLDFTIKVNGREQSAKQYVLNKEKSNGFSQRVKDYANEIRDLNTRMGTLKRQLGLSSVEGNAYTNIPLKAISPETAKNRKNDPLIKTQMGRKAETAEDAFRRGDVNANATASATENILNSQNQMEQKLFFQRLAQMKFIVKQANRDGSKSELDLEYEKLAEIEKELEKTDLPEQVRTAYTQAREEILRLFGRPTNNVTDMYNTYYNSLIGVDGEVYRINGAFQQAMYVAGKIDVPPKPETTKGGSLGVGLLEKAYGTGKGTKEWYDSHVLSQLVANVYRQGVAVLLNSAKLLIQNTLQVALDGVYGTARGLVSDLANGRTFSSKYFSNSLLTVSQIPNIIIKSTNSKYAPFLTALDQALGQEEFYAGYADEKVPVIAKAPANWGVVGKGLEGANRILTSQGYQRTVNGFIVLQQNLINKLGRSIGLLNVMPRMLEKAQARGLELADFDASKPEWRQLLSESVVYYEQVRPSGSSASSQSVGYTSISKALPLEIILKGWMFAGFNLLKKNLTVLLGRDSTTEMRKDAMINGIFLVAAIAGLLAYFQPDEEDLLSNKDNPTNGGQKSSKATFPIYIPGTDGSVNVGDAAQMAPANLTGPIILKQIWDVYSNLTTGSSEARASYYEDLNRNYNPFVDSTGATKSPQAIVGGTVGGLVIPFKTDLNKLAALFQPNEKAISKENPWSEFIQNALGANLSATLSNAGVPVGDVPDREYRIYNEKTKKMEEVSKPRDTFSRVLDILSPANNENINVAYLENGIRNAETQLARDKQNLVKDLSKGKITQESYNAELAKLEAKQDKFNLDTVLAPSGASRSGGGSSGGGISGKGQSLSSAISSLKSSGKGNTFSIKYPKVKTPKSRLDKLIKDKDKLGKNDSNTIKLGKNDGFTTESELSRGARLKASGVNGGLSGLSSRLGGGISVKTPSISVKKPGAVSISKGAKSSMPKLIPLKGIKARLDKDKRIKL